MSMCAVLSSLFITLHNIMLGAHFPWTTLDLKAGYQIRELEEWTKNTVCLRRLMSIFWIVISSLKPEKPISAIH